MSPSTSMHHIRSDAPTSGRTMFAGGRLAADFIARTLQLSQKKEVLVLQCSEQELSQAKGPNINKMRLEGFLDLMNQSFPAITIHLEYFDTKLQAEEKDNQILNLVRNYQNKVQAMYLIPAFNTDFLHALDATGVHDTITVLSMTWTAPPCTI